MTPQEHAESIAQKFLDPTFGHGYVKAAIVAAILECTNSEVERRRVAERKLPPPIDGQTGIAIICTPERTMLRVWNPHRGRWSETNLIEFPEAVVNA